MRCGQISVNVWSMLGWGIHGVMTGEGATGRGVLNVRACLEMFRACGKRIPGEKNVVN